MGAKQESTTNTVVKLAKNEAMSRNSNNLSLKQQLLLCAIKLIRPLKMIIIIVEICSKCFSFHSLSLGQISYFNAKPLLRIVCQYCNRSICLHQSFYFPILPLLSFLQLLSLTQSKQLSLNIGTLISKRNIMNFPSS